MAELDNHKLDIDGETFDVTEDDGIKLEGGTYPRFYMVDPQTKIAMRAETSDGLKLALRSVRGKWSELEHQVPNPKERRTKVAEELHDITRSLRGKVEFIVNDKAA